MWKSTEYKVILIIIIILYFRTWFVSTYFAYLTKIYANTMINKFYSIDLSSKQYSGSWYSIDLDTVHSQFLKTQFSLVTFTLLLSAFSYESWNIFFVSSHFLLWLKYLIQSIFCTFTHASTVLVIAKAPAGNYMFKVSIRNICKRFEICWKLTIKTSELVSLLLTLNIFHTLF